MTLHEENEVGYFLVNETTAPFQNIIETLEKDKSLKPLEFANKSPDSLQITKGNCDVESFDRTIEVNPESKDIASLKIIQFEEELRPEIPVNVTDEIIKNSKRSDTLKPLNERFGPETNSILGLNFQV